MNVLELLKGKHIRVKTDVGVDVELEIAEVKEEHHSREIGESNAANDWWPETHNWTTYRVKFTNGHAKTYQSLNEINVVK